MLIWVLRNIAGRVIEISQQELPNWEPMELVPPGTADKVESLELSLRQMDEENARLRGSHAALGELVDEMNREGEGLW